MGVKDKDGTNANNLMRLVRQIKVLSLPADGITVTEEMIPMYRELIRARRLLKKYAKRRREA